MSRHYIFVALLIVTMSFPTRASNNLFITLCYHDIIEGLTDRLGEDQMAVGTDNLIAQFSWMKEQGYQVVSLQDILDAKQGGKALPEKAVLITFDDGYISVYNYLYPILKMYNYTAVVAVVGQWLSVKPGETVQYGDRDKKPRSDFLSWEQIKEMQASGHVEIASHSFNLHRGELGNPQGNVQPAATTRLYIKHRQRYETDQQYYDRIKIDLKTNLDLIAKHTGIRPRSMVWPYGQSSKETVSISKELGMPITMTLKAGNNVFIDLPEVRRKLITSNPTLSDFVYEMEEKKPISSPIRAMRIDMDDVYDEDPKKFTQNFDRLLDRIKLMKINTVYLSAFSDVNNDGFADSVYFPTPHFLTRADILNRVSWQIQTRAGGGDHINVHMVMPITAFKNEHGLLSEQAILGIYADMAKHAYVEGLLFSDAKGSGSDGFLKQLINKVKYYRTRTKKAALLLSSQAIIDASVQPEYWDNLKKEYNAFVVNIDPQSESPESHIHALLQALPRKKDLMDFVFELQTINKQNRERISDSILSSEIDYLLENRAIQLSHYPDDTKGNYPTLELIKSKVSVRSFPFGD